MSILKAGAAKIDITPDYPVWLDGNPRDDKSEGVHDPISARALVLEGMEGPVALVSLELGLLSVDVVGWMREAISQAAGIAPSRQVIACGHIHSAPAVFGLFCPREDGYLEWLARKLTALVAEARRNARPALAGSGSGQESTISEYRRLWTKDGRIAMNWDNFSWDDILGPAGVPDPEVGVVRIDAEDGRVIAVIYNHAGHPNTLPGTSFQISGDYPAFASDMIERELGGVAVFTNGAQGSVDIPAFRERDWEGLERKGTWLAREVLAVAHRIRPAVESCVLRRVEFRVGARKIDPQYLKWSREVLAATGEHVVNVRDGVDDAIYARLCIALAKSGVKEYELEMMGLLVGGAAFVTIPGELFTEIGLWIKRASPMGRTFIVGIANGWLGYIPTSRAIAEGGYETRPGMSCMDVHADDVVREQALGLLERLHSCVSQSQ